MIMSSPFLNHRHRGFSLVELAIVLVIVALLSGGLMMSLSAQQEAAAAAETQRRLNDARDALVGFAAANGRLPCPAKPGATGDEAPAGGGNCANPLDGLLPAVTLGIGPTDAQGYAIDAWGNPIRYAITTYSNATYCPGGHCFATTNALKAAWNGGTSPNPDLEVCNTAAGMPTHCIANTTLTNKAVAVIYSRGKNGSATPASDDEKANSDGNALFVSHTPTPAGSTNEFDDLVVWLSPNILYNRLIAAGRLP